MRDIEITACVRAVQAGELVVFPTDTVYGIASQPYSEAIVSALLSAKGRDEKMPPPVLAPDVETALSLGQWNSQTLPHFSSLQHSELRKMAETLGHAFWPGGITLILPTQQLFGWDMNTFGPTVAVRVPDHPLTLKTLNLTGPLAVTSANLTGAPPALTVSQAEDYFGATVKYYLDGGPASVGVASTIIDCTTLPLQPLRQGAIEWGEIQQAIG